MRKHVIFDEVHVAVLVPADTPPKSIAALRRAVRGKTFKKAIETAAISHLQRNPALAEVKVNLSR